MTVEGEARVRYSFKAETTRELPCSKVFKQLAHVNPDFSNLLGKLKLARAVAGKQSLSTKILKVLISGG